MSPGQAFVVPPRDLIEDAPAQRFADAVHLETTVREHLVAWFAAMGIDPALRVNADDLLRHLDEKQIALDPVSVRQIFGSTHAKGGGVMTGNAFVDQYIKRVIEAQRDVWAFDKAIANLAAQIEVTRNQLKRAEAISLSSARQQTPEEPQLVVQIVSLTFEAAPSDHDAYYRVHLTCNERGIASRYEPYADRQVYWNEMFSFTAGPDDGDLYIQLQREGSDESLGETQIPFAILYDQKKHDCIEELSVSGRPCELRLSCQLLYSRRSLWERYLKEFIAKRDSVLIDREKAERNLERLTFPFDLSRKIRIRDVIAQKMKEGPDLASTFVEKAFGHMHLSNDYISHTILNYVYLILAANACWARASFLDVGLACTGLWLSSDEAKRRWTVTNYTWALVALSCAIIYDSIWMSLFFLDGYALMGDYSTTLLLWTQVSVLFTFIVKFILLVFVWKCQYDLRKKQQPTSSASTQQFPRYGKA